VLQVKVIHVAPFSLGNDFSSGYLHGSEAGPYLRLIDFVYHSTLGLRVIKKKQKYLHVGVILHHGLELRPPAEQREISLLTTYWSESTLSS